MVRKSLLALAVAAVVSGSGVAEAGPFHGHRQPVRSAAKCVGGACRAIVRGAGSVVVRTGRAVRTGLSPRR